MPEPDDALKLPEGMIARREGDAQSLIRREAEAWLVEQCRDTLHSSGQWPLETGSLEEYEESCASHRARWSRAVGEWSFDAPFDVQVEPFFDSETAVGHWIRIDLADGLQGRAVYALPKHGTRPLPMVIAQHGLGSSPERVFGPNDGEGLYHGFAAALLEAGYAVLAPANVTGNHPRARLTRLCHLPGRTLWGLEIGKLRRLIDYVSGQPEIDADRIGMWGLSLGGYYTAFAAALELRIKVGVGAAFFNDRFRKMAVSSPLYTAYIDVDEEHFWIPGHFSGGFGDAELVSLICPRPLQIQQGRADGIGWWPHQEAEFRRAAAPYKGLGIPDRIEYAGHDGGHEVLVGRGLQFLETFL